jgi:hypothetical protein
MELIGKTYKERCDNQLEEWVKGNPIHNTKDEECCPDFSCCTTNSLQPLEVRQTFKAVCEKVEEEGYNEECHPHYDTMMGMLMGFLGGMVGDKVHITDGDMSHKINLN